MAKPYILEIYSPGHVGEMVALRLETDQPPMPISKGDLVNLRGYGRAMEIAGCSVVRVVNVEHVFWDVKLDPGDDESQWTTHQIMVFTTKVDDVAETRLPGYPHVGASMQQNSLRDDDFRADIDDILRNASGPQEGARSRGLCYTPQGLRAANGSAPGRERAAVAHNYGMAAEFRPAFELLRLN